MPPKTQLNDAFAASLENWMPKTATWLLAVSGGLDSMVLLHFLHRVGYGSLVICHVNHQLRGDDSRRDADFVSEAASVLGLECERVEVDVAGHAASEKCSIERAARELRYQALARIFDQRECRGVVTAHHADDQVETVLINFFRGSGARGISGMEAVSKRDDSKLEIFRPFLLIPRRELERYAGENGVEFRQDASNFEDFALRNRVRNTLVPTLNEVFERDVSGAVLRAAALASRDEAWMSEAQGQLPLKENGLDVALLREMSAAVRDRLLLRWLRENRVPDCGYEEVSRLSRIVLSDGNPAKVNLPGGVHARRRAGVLFLEKDGEAVS
ncbi:MAG: tRNA lysidine(34) synthetase TilS [Verrucomicrobiales bacterium]|nr:tRNA lysidine(34) synthetase TilS [Verrucomicrobiales bacterium]